MSEPGPRVVLFSDGGDWHETQLKAAFRARGAPLVVATLAACALSTDSPSGIVIPGFPDALPQAALVRGIGAGGFEQITLRLGILHALAARGVAVWNEARAIERCVDKSMTSFLLAAAGIPTPATLTCENKALAERRVAERGIQVLKPLFGAQGRGLRQIARGAELPAAEEVSGVYYLQDFVRPRGASYADWRVLVSNGRAIGQMRRASSTWITNIRQGGAPVADDDAAMAALAVEAAAAVGARFAGVDLIRDPGGRALALEVNSMPAWRGLQEVCATNIAAALADDLLAGLAAP